MAKAKKKSTISPAGKLSDHVWRTVEKTLSASADRVLVRTELERIARDTATPRQRAEECDDRAQLCRNFSQVLAAMELIENKPALTEQLRRQINYETEQVEVFRRIAKEKQPRKFLRHCEILWLWEYVGGSRPATTTPKKRSETTGWAPQGEVFPYFQAAAKVVFGKSPNADQIKKIISSYRHLNFSSQKMAGMGSMIIDDSKVFIIRGGQRVDADPI